VSLVEDWEYEYYAGMTPDYVQQLVEKLDIRLVREPVPDGSAPSIDRLFQLVRLLQEYEQREIKVYVHCVGGLGRTPTVLAAYLMFSRNLDLYTALRKIQQVNPEMTLTDSQFETLKKFEEMLRKRALDQT